MNRQSIGSAASLPALVALLFVSLLSGCLGGQLTEDGDSQAGQTPPGSERPDSPILAGKCEPGVPFEIALQDGAAVVIPPSIIGKKNGKGVGKALGFWIWYLKALHDKKNPIFRNQIEFPMTDDRLVDAQFTDTKAVVDALVFDADRVRWERMMIALDGLKGAQIHASAVQTEVIDTYEFDIPLHIPRGLAKMLVDGEKPDADEKHGKVWLKSFSRVRITLDLKKFSFGGIETADDIFRRAADTDRKLALRLRHLDGGFRILTGGLTLKGLSPGDCNPPPPGPDTRAPLIQIVSQSAAGLTTQTSQLLRLSADEPVAFSCRFDLGQWQACSSAADNRLGEFTAADLADGVHQVSVRANDVAGNMSEVLTIEWTVDTTAPVLTRVRVSPDGALTDSQSLEYEFAASESVQAVCSLDGAAPVACVSPLTLNGLADGEHRFEIRATDLVGLQSAPLAHEWRVQAAPPSVTITSIDPAKSPIAADSIAFNFAGAPGTESYLCSLDSAAPVACVSPLTLNGLADGAHTFEVAAVDGLGRTGAPASHSWSVDTLAPDAFFLSISPEDSPTSSSDAIIAFGSGETATFRCALDGAAAAPCASPVALSGLGEGEHRFRVTAVDMAGNVSSAPAEYVWLVDQTAPVLTITAAEPSAALINVDTLQLMFTATEVSTFECRLDSAEFSGCASPSVFSGLSEGAHLIQVRATDRAGNVSAVRSHDVSVDLSAPGVTIDSVNPTVTSSRSRSIAFSSPDTTASFQCRLNDKPYAPCASPASYTDLAEGTHVFQVRAADLAGNVSADVAQDSWRVDLTAPETTITSTVPAGSPTDSTSIILSFAASEANVRFECQRDSGPFMACASPHVINNLADGAHVFRVRAIDEADNVDGAPAEYNWVIDTTPLSLTGFAVSNITRTSAQVTWETNRPSTSRVEVTHVISGVVTVHENLAMNNPHSVLVTGLTANTLYNVVAVSTSASGQTVRSSAFSFRTAR